MRLGIGTRREVMSEAVLGQRGRVGFASLMFGLHQAGEALVPVLIGVIVDRSFGSGSGGVGELIRWLAVLGVVFATLSLSYRFGARQAEAAAEWAAHRIRMRITERVLHPRGGAESGRLPGALASIATSDAQRVGAINSALPNGIAAIVAMLVAGISLLRLSLPLGLLVLIGGPVLLWLVHLLGKPLESRSEAEQDRAAQASGVATDLVTGLRVLKGIGAEQTAGARYRQISSESLLATLRAARAQAGYHGAMLTMSGLFLALVTLAGGRLALQGRITVGELVAAVGLAQFLLGPLQVFAWVSSELAAGRASASRVAEVLSSPPAVDAGSTASALGAAPAPAAGRAPVTGRVELRKLSYGSLFELDWAVGPGELVGLVATDPADGVALLRCLGREADPDSGAVELDGVPLTALDPDDVRSSILVAAHDAELFGGTLRENLGEGVPDGRIQAALEASNADEVLRILPGGAGGILTERGGNLSGGQRQRVALARALARDAPVLVLHDPTTAVDTVTELRIADGIRRLRRERTTILLTTSPALLAATDRVLLLVNGRLTAQGSHQQLLDDECYRTAVLA